MACRRVRDQLYKVMRGMQAERRANTTRPVVKLPRPDLNRPEFSYLSRFGKATTTGARRAMPLSMRYAAISENYPLIFSMVSKALHATWPASSLTYCHTMM